MSPGPAEGASPPAGPFPGLGFGEPGSVGPVALIGAGADGPSLLA